MPVEKRPASNFRDGPVRVSSPSIHLCIPDLTADEDVSQDQPAAVRRPRESTLDPISLARSKISEKRFRDGHQQVTSMIEDLRDRRRRRFRLLWTASIALTACSIVALGFGLFQTTNKGEGESIRSNDSRARARTRKNRSMAERDAATLSRPIPGDLKLLPTREPVRPALYETPTPAEDSGAWFEGTIADGESDQSSDGAVHDHH